MRTAYAIHTAWKTAKGLGLCFVLSFAGGWLTRELFRGKIEPADRAAAYILDLTLLVMVGISFLVARKRWGRDQIAPAAKGLFILALVFLVVFFIIGWQSDISLK